MPPSGPERWQSRRRQSDQLDPGEQEAPTSPRRKRSVPIADIEDAAIGDSESAADGVGSERYRVSASEAILLFDLDRVIDFDVDSQVAAAVFGQSQRTAGCAVVILAGRLVKFIGSDDIEYVHWVMA